MEDSKGRPQVPRLPVDVAAEDLERWQYLDLFRMNPQDLWWFPVKKKEKNMTHVNNKDMSIVFVWAPELDELDEMVHLYGIGSWLSPAWKI